MYRTPKSRSSKQRIGATRALAAIAAIMLATVAMLAALAVPAGAQNTTQQQLDAAKALWEAPGPPSYTMSYTYCGNFVGEQSCSSETVQVTLGIITDHVPGQFGYEITVDSIFDEIQRAILFGYHRIEVAYDPVTGHPMTVEIDAFDDGRNDDVITFETSSFALASPEQALQQVITEWNEGSPVSYIWTYEYCNGILGCTTETVAVDDQETIVSSTNANGGPAIWDFTIPDTFADLQNGFDADAFAIDFAFILREGIRPQQYSIDLFDGGADDERSFSVVKFQYVDPNAQARLDQAIADWGDRPSDNYTLSYTYCGGISGCHDETVTVVGGTVTSSQDDNNGGSGIWNLTVEDLFAEIQQGIDGDVFKLRAGYGNDAVPLGYTIDLFDGGNDDEIFYRTRAFAFDSISSPLQATVTCLAGNGRIDVNIVNTGAAAARYGLQIGSLSPREASVAPDSWWRSPVTGRPDGPIQVTVTRDGTVVYDQSVTVACDANPAVSSPEVQVYTWCIGGRGMIWAQFANPTNTRRAYVIDVGGIRRSTTAAAYGAAFRGVSGRPNATYAVSVSVGGVVIDNQQVPVNC